MSNFSKRNIICVLVINCILSRGICKYTKSLEDLVDEYDDDKNSMIAVTESDNGNLYNDFYDEIDNENLFGSSMNMIFFGPSRAFMRLDSETLLHIMLHIKKHLVPIEKVLLAWDIITDGKTAAFLQGREYIAFGNLLNVIPEEDLYYVNFGDPSVLKYFATTNLELHQRKIGILVAAYRRYFGKQWYQNSTYINELGYLLCGFPWYTLEKITPEMFRDISFDALGKLTKCNVRQSQALYNIATHIDAYGIPYKWTSREITRLNGLFIYIPKEDISTVQLEAVIAITPNIMNMIHQEKLKYFTKQQIMRLKPETRRIYILRMHLKTSLDVIQIVNSRVVKMRPNLIKLTIVLSFENLILLYLILY